MEPTDDPLNEPPAVASALPSVGARIIAFVAILVGGVCGALIGYALVDIQCEGSCSSGQGVGTLVGGLAGALGVAVVAVLALRAMGEWKTIQDKTTAAQARETAAAAQPRNRTRRKPSA
jgi:hypothetical protein